MLTPNDYLARGWEVVPCFLVNDLDKNLFMQIENHPESPGKSSWGTRNILYSFILSMRPKLILEIGAHIGSASIIMGAALKSNKFGTLYTLEPQEHYFKLLCHFIHQANLDDYVKPLKIFSTDPSLRDHLVEPVDFIFLDANHSYSSALADIRLSAELLSENGILFLDDVGYPKSSEMCSEGKGGVRQALKDFISVNSDCFKCIFLEHPFWLNPCGMAIVCKQNYSK